MDEIEVFINLPWPNILAFLGVVALVGSKYVPFIRRFVGGLLGVVGEMLLDPFFDRVLEAHNSDENAHGILKALALRQMNHEGRTASNGHPGQE